jgi:hypothetical protein
MKPFKLLGIFLLFITIVSSFSFCGKGTSLAPEVEDLNKKPDTYFYVRCKVDGKWVERKVKTIARLNYNGAVNPYNFNGDATDLNTASQVIAVSIDFKKPVQKNFNYTNSSSDPDLNKAFVQIKELNEEFYQAVPYEAQGFTRDVNVQLTEITDTYVKGTFSGTVYNVFPTLTSASPKKVITDGKFYLNVVYNR